ncbi:hypothetical protein [Thalassoroseus pseudoceratinae]|uniref:hypothetical protein n=1 Tax=Thalassoroseus pseudoceratinae TaxID=2713176 RepID=UPI0014230C2A|nr:hypothetical protein [Thalassoroseus pseudoceratinae]
MSSLPPERASRWLRRLLRLNAVVLMLAFPAVVLPDVWMNSAAITIGLGELSDTPLFNYLARTLSALYGMCGIATWILASDLPRYAPLVKLWGCSAIAAGVGFTMLDLIVGMPGVWAAIEGGYLLPTGAFVLWLDALRTRTNDPLVDVQAPLSESGS